ncbi:MAG: hypothetical protein H6812_13840 [Phycisphaeraceae bacterium]|nr:hypothetical protein [Phycisphaerales bacterium]MCB9844319.1 hypothetical protein [Phycisphaeraceae bacterium]
MRHIGYSPFAMIPWVLLSVALHAGAVLWAGARHWSTPDLRNDPLAIDPPDLLDEVRPGIEESDAMVISWIGYDEPTPHSADPAEFDQPALTLDAGAPPSPPMVEAPEPTPAPSPVAESEAAAETFAQAMRILGAQASDGAQMVEQIGREFREAARQSARPLRELLAQLMRPVEVPQPTKVAEKPPSESDIPPAETTAPPAEGGPGDPGIDADKESTPVSIAKVPIELRKVGNPLAAAGLEIKTVRPRFTHYTTLTVSPHDPLIRVEFNRAGKVVSASLLESSGHKDVDNPILDAIYQWTAAGKPLESLNPDSSPATIAIEFRIVL